MKYIDGKICPYCDKATEYVDSKEIYGKSYGMVYICKPCHSWVGVHKSNPTESLGRLANHELREAKKEAHFYFDKIWKTTKLTRNETYNSLSKFLKIEKEYCHIGMFDIEKCKKVVEFSKIILN